jgi:hypothetical protein
MYRVISTSHNVRLMLERNDLLAVAGFSVISPKHPEHTPELAAQEDVDAVIIGHSVDPKVRKRIIRGVRKACPGCLICFVYAAPDRVGEPLADVSLDVTKGPEPLIVFLTDRLPREKASSDSKPTRKNAHDPPTSKAL